ncbi:MAG: hypothetical protein NVSMB53_12030 [Gemmatimonadaceae bacterium]
MTRVATELSYTPRPHFLKEDAMDLVNRFADLSPLNDMEASWLMCLLDPTGRTSIAEKDEAIDHLLEGTDRLPHLRRVIDLYADNHIIPKYKSWLKNSDSSVADIIVGKALWKPGLGRQALLLALECIQRRIIADTTIENIVRQFRCGETNFTERLDIYAALDSDPRGEIRSLAKSARDYDCEWKKKDDLQALIDAQPRVIRRKRG